MCSRYPGWWGGEEVTYTGPTTDPGLTSSGANSTIIQVGNFTGGNATIDASGSMSGFAGVTGVSNGVSGLFATAVGDGNATVIYRGGTIDVSGTFANGIFAAAGEGGMATVTTDPGTIIKVTSTSGEPLKPGIAVDSAGTAAAGGAATGERGVNNPDARSRGRRSQSSQRRYRYSGIQL